MKIPLPAGNFIYVGKQNKEIQLTKKSADLVRDDQGNINGTVPSYSLENVEKYVNIVFSPNSYIRNFVFLFENIAEIQFPINYLTSRIKNGNFVVKRWDDDTVVWSDSATSPKDKIVGEKMKRFFNQPNPLQTFKEFVQQVFIYKYLVGDSYIYAPTLPGTQNLWDICENFWVLPSHLVSIESGYNNQLFTPKRDQNPIKSYNIHSSGGYLQCDPRLIMHYRDNFCLELNQNYFYGRSRLLAQKYPISNLCAVYEARNIIYTKRGALGAIVNEKKDADTFIPLTDPEKKEIRNEFNSTYGITNRKDPVAVIDVPVKYIPFGMSIQDLQPFDEALADASSIAGAYNIDSVLIPRKDQSTFNNLKEAEVKVYTSVIIPDVKEFCEKLSEFLGLNAFFIFHFCCNLFEVVVGLGHHFPQVASQPTVTHMQPLRGKFVCSRRTPVCRRAELEG